MVAVYLTQHRTCSIVIALNHNTGSAAIPSFFITTNMRKVEPSCLR
jgi:hypothetical protein